jgi:hypothetical protein
MFIYYNNIFFHRIPISILALDNNEKINNFINEICSTSLKHCEKKNMTPKKVILKLFFYFPPAEDSLKKRLILLKVLTSKCSHSKKNLKKLILPQ